MIPLLARRHGLFVLAAAVLAHGVTVLIWPAAHWSMIDLEVYRAAGAVVLDGGRLYEQGVTASLKFVYPPFAALLFTPLAMVSLDVLRVLWAVGNLVLVVMVVRWAAPTARPGVVAALAGVICWLDPVRTTVYLGQVNWILLALVAWDLLRNGGRRWQGVGIGIAAAIKLTPLLFVVYLLLTRRFRAAGVAVATVAATVAAGFALLPADAAAFWLDGAFAEVGRINPVDAATNHSLRGALARTMDHETGLWLVGAAILAAVSLAVAVRARRRGDEVLGMAVTGLCATAVSPFSWTHHWVWFAPLVLAVVHRRAFAGVVVALTFAWFVRVYPPESGLIPETSVAALGGPVAGNLYFLLFLASLPYQAKQGRRRGQAEGERQPGRQRRPVGGQPGRQQPDRVRRRQHEPLAAGAPGHRLGEDGGDRGGGAREPAGHADGPGRVDE
ncbi:glycosyltransferase 87 family protein [Actinokineospora fastidiosa]|uniref:Conserved hypothtical membrane protein n=1 Tax=Actinokineospora fastidiosa TaxID=1816 RepID=A0A918LIQ8_9PSEU|nr:glycosyltransferase 87 family protein [Actinokineospora fastidiosa]GGS53255.1 conserved hypothtical membrane protein [Actinokineospora fastidiosa]